MIVEVVNQVRNGIRCAAPTAEKYPHYVESALERLDEAKRIYEQGERRRELRSALQRIQRYSIGPEKQSLQTVIEGLDRKLVTDAVIVRMLPAALARVKTLPSPSQAFQAPVIMREMRANASRTIEFDASVWEKDRHGTRVDPMGLDTENFRLNPLFMWQHSWSGGIFGGTPDIDNVLGRVVSWNATPRAFTIKAEFATHPKAELALSLVRQKMLSAVSIAFVPKKVERSIEDGVEVPIIRKADLLEVSLVFVPSSPSSGATGRK